MRASGGDASGYGAAARLATYNRAFPLRRSLSLRSFQSIPTAAFLDALASRAPVPGGGAAAALAGCQGMALVCMVLNLTVGRKRFRRHEGILRPIRQRLEAGRLTLLDLADQDAAAYAEVDRCLQLPAEDPTARTFRRRELDRALYRAAVVPNQVATTCRDALLDTREVADRGNRTVLSDVMVGTHLLLAAVRGSDVMVQVNLGSASPGTGPQTLSAEITACVAEAVEAGNRILDRCAARMNRSR